MHIAASHALDLAGVSGPLQASNEQSFNDVCLNPLGTSLQQLIQVGFFFFFPLLLTFLKYVLKLYQLV